VISDKKKPLHLIIRYNPIFNGKDTLKEHIELDKQIGAVWWGKFGVGVAPKIVEQIKLQLEEKVTTYAYLSTKSNIGHKARIVGITGGGARTLYPTPEALSTPQYYRKDNCTLWVKLAGIKETTNKDIENLFLYNGYGKPDLSGMKGIIYVRN